MYIPPTVDNSIKRLRKALVLEELKNGNAYKMIRKDQARILEKPLLSIVDLDAKYEYRNLPILQNITDGILPIDTRALEKILEDLGQVFIKSIITNGNNFVLITQLDIFLSNQVTLKDCAYPVPKQYLTSLNIDLKQKIRFKTSWNELIILNGRYQILVTGGLIRTKKKPLPHIGIISNDVLLKSQQRYLIHYKNECQFISWICLPKIRHSGFRSCTSPYCSNAVTVGNKPDLSHIVSRIICHYSFKSCISNDVIDILNLLLKMDTFMKLIKSKNQPKRCRDLSFLLNTKVSNQTRSIINKLIKIEQITSTVSPTRIATPDHENEGEDTKLRDLVNNSLSSNR